MNTTAAELLSQLQFATDRMRQIVTNGASTPRLQAQKEMALLCAHMNKLQRELHKVLDNN